MYAIQLKIHLGIAILIMLLTACSSKKLPVPSELKQAPSDTKPSVRQPSSDIRPPVKQNASLLEASLPSAWRGIATIRAGRQVFRHPILLRLAASNKAGGAPIKFVLTTTTQSKNRNAAAAGTVRLKSFNTVRTAVGEPVELDFYNIQLFKDGFRATLTREQEKTSSSLNSFVSPPPPVDPRRPGAALWQRELEFTGNAVEYVFRPNTRLVIQMRKKKLVGKIEGIGFSSGIFFSAGDIPVIVTFSAQRSSG
ncbi:hypothetical protein IQ266_11925 [filamentous cyanobacterium LEGE 11480]|uniref:Uncharacterized protein n=1 Tax=Romeriopsis navalis LEGE 11480 TaxID=2777977 RepID=A0A928Z4Q1_9CYAN|nr:hypothetical protein [Romeriopsis navalis]MBE9030440.1 hypothetical protein [Romeriopsis navalis LEGE 11480]